KGSVFWFTARFEKQLRPVNTLRLNHSVLAGLRVLIVDDNLTNRKILSHQLGSYGMRHVEAESGKSALALLRSATQTDEAFDLAILDLMMPGMDGFELARVIKSDPSIT